MEGFESLENTLIKLLKEKGLEDPEFRKLSTSWTSKQEELVEKSKDHRLAQIKFARTVLAKLDNFSCIFFV